MPQRLRKAPRRPSGGFTLIELMVVVAIIGLLAGIAVPVVIRTLRQAKENTLKHDLRVMRDLIQQYKVDKKKFPETLQAIADDGYLKEIPRDPVSNTKDTWIEVHNECEDPDDPNCDAGVVDVKSGAVGTDLAGQPFAEY